MLGQQLPSMTFRRIVYETNNLFLSLAFLLAGAVIPAVAGNTVTYTYDALGRPIKITFDNGTTQTYTYDAAGNRVTDVGVCAPRWLLERRHLSGPVKNEAPSEPLGRR